MGFQPIQNDEGSRSSSVKETDFGERGFWPKDRTLGLAFRMALCVGFVRLARNGKLFLDVIPSEL